MADEGEGLELLIKQRKSRPSYQRSVSDSLSQQDAQPVPNRVSKKKPEPQKYPRGRVSALRKTKETNDDGGSGSEYETAPEDFKSSSSECDEESSQPLYSESVKSGNPMEEDCSHLLAKSSSKRKGKWKRREIREKINEMLRNIDVDVGDLDLMIYLSATDEDTDVSLSKEVPRLTDLCLQAKRQNMLQNQTLPSGLKGIMGIHNSKQADKNKQIHHLEKLLSQFEYHVKKDNLSPSQFLISHLRSGDGKKVNLEHRRATRNVFCLGKSYQVSGEWYHDHPSLIIPATHCRGEGLGIVSDCEIFEVFVTYVSLLLPKFLVRSQREDSPTHVNLLPCNIEAASAQTALNKVKNYCHQRFPLLTKYSFTEAMLYAWWARGNWKEAESSFLSFLHNTSPGTVNRSLYTTEIARFYQHIGEYGKAAKFYLTLDDTNDSKEEAEIPFCKLQKMMLAASVNDTGVLTQEKAEAATLSWQQVFKSLDRDMSQIPEYVLHGALVSYVFVHSGKCTVSGKDWLHSAVSNLRNLPADQAKPYLALIYAMEGQIRKSANTYWFNHTFGSRDTVDVDTHLISTESRVKSSPWKPVLTYFQETEKKIAPIQLFWRVNLCQPVWDTSGDPAWQIADYSTPKSALWLQEDGYLTGDFQMAFPPLKKVLLDPYTGQIVFSQTPTEEYTMWKETPVRTWTGVLQDYLHDPVVHRVYENGGVSVDYTQRRSPSNMDINTYPYINTCEVLWNGQGQTIKIDLKKEIKAICKKRLQQFVRDQHASKTLRFPLSEALDAIELHDERGFNIMNPQGIFQRLDYKNNVLNHELRYPKDKKGAKKKFQGMLNSANTRNDYWLNDYRTCGSTLILVFGRERGSPEKNDVIAVFNCKSAKTFERYHVYACRLDFQINQWNCGNNMYSFMPAVNDCPKDKPLNQTCFLSTPHDNKKCYPEAKVFCINDRPTSHYSSYNQPKNQPKKTQRHHLFNEDGEIIQTEETDPLTSKHATSYFSHVIGTTMYGILDNRVISQNELLCRKSQRFEPIKKLMTLQKWLLLLTDLGLQILDSDLNPLTWKLGPNSEKLQYLISINWHCLEGQFGHVEVLADKELEMDVTEAGVRRCKAIIALDAHTLVIELTENRSEIDCVLHLGLPGYPTEASFISGFDGVLIIASIRNPDSNSNKYYYTETLYHVGYDGSFRGILPCLGSGPHTLLPVELPGSKEAAKRHPGLGLENPGLYVFMKDGYGSICAFKIW